MSMDKARGWLEQSGNTTGMAALQTFNIVNTLGNMLLGKKPETMSELDRVGRSSGKQLDTLEENTNVVPLIYGLNRVGSTVIWRETNEVLNGSINNDYWAIQVLGQGEINSVLKILIAGEAITKNGDLFHTKYTQVNTGYHTTPDIGIKLKDIVFNTNNEDLTKTWFELVNGELNYNIFSVDGPDWANDINAAAAFQSPNETAQELFYETDETVFPDNFNSFLKPPGKRFFFEGLTFEEIYDRGNNLLTTYVPTRNRTVEPNYLIFDFPSERQLKKLKLSFIGSLNDWSYSVNNGSSWQGMIHNNYNNGTVEIEAFDTDLSDWISVDPRSWSMMTDLSKSFEEFQSCTDTQFAFFQGSVDISLNNPNTYKKYRLKVTNFRTIYVSAASENFFDASAAYPTCDFYAPCSHFPAGNWNISLEPHGSNKKHKEVLRTDWYNNVPDNKFKSGGFHKIEIETDNESTIDFPKEIAFASVHQEFEWDENAHTELDKLTFEVEGRIIRTINSNATLSSNKTYSTNPAEIIVDMIQHYLGFDDDEFDLEDFLNCKNKCNEYGFDCNIVFQGTGINIQSSIAAVLQTFNGVIFFANGKWKLKMLEKEKPVDMNIDNQHILAGSFGVSMPSMSMLSNKVIVNYINREELFLPASTTIEDEQLIISDEKEYETTFDINGISTLSHANKIASIFLNSSRYSESLDEETGELVRRKQSPLFISFSTSIKYTELEIYDIIKVEHDLLDRPRQFLIQSLEHTQEGIINITASEYCQTHFKTNFGEYII